ncbi:16339_t:CDS:2, partial [Dentiscutata erythropus]
MNFLNIILFILSTTIVVSLAQFGSPGMGSPDMGSPGFGGGGNPKGGNQGFDPSGLLGGSPKGSNQGFDPSSGSEPKSGGNPAPSHGQNQAPKSSSPNGNASKSPPAKTAPSSSQGKAPTSGSPQTSPAGSGKGAPSSGSKSLPDVRKVPWQEKEKACILVSGPPNNTIIEPETKHRISWNQSPCQMSARVVGMFHVFLYNNLQAVPDEKAKKRDYSPNGKPRITNASNFYIRVETISKSGIFGATPPLGGTYGPISLSLEEPPPGWNETHADAVSEGQKVHTSSSTCVVKFCNWLG